MDRPGRFPTVFVDLYVNLYLLVHIPQGTWGYMKRTGTTE